MNVADVKKAYLAVLGNPQSGVFVDFADAICEAIVADCCSDEKPEAKSFLPVTEKRVEKITETRQCSFRDRFGCGEASEPIFICVIIVMCN